MNTIMGVDKVFEKGTWSWPWPPLSRLSSHTTYLFHGFYWDTIIIIIVSSPCAVFQRGLNATSAIFRIWANTRWRRWHWLYFETASIIVVKKYQHTRGKVFKLHWENRQSDDMWTCGWLDSDDTPDMVDGHWMTLEIQWQFKMAPQFETKWISFDWKERVGITNVGS